MQSWAAELQLKVESDHFGLKNMQLIAMAMTAMSIVKGVLDARKYE